MLVFTNPLELQQHVQVLKKQGTSIGFVPTMGYLHDGHISLLKAARQDNDFVILSIYVNPLQFAPTEDLAAYPRDFDRDSQLAEEAGVDLIFYPSNETLYPEGYSTYVTEEEISARWCGASRKTHFRGVTTIVLKLFNCTLPDRAYFGAKDIQQALIIRKMVSDLHIPTDIVTCPIVREDDGLAMSSRNVYLSPSERAEALVLKKALDHAQQQFSKGIKSSKILAETMTDIIKSAASARIDYIACADGSTLEPKQELSAGDRILLAVFIGKTRLIDNCRLH
ncbi:MAG: pantoate--beta-alanine ligase [Candidatus Auribacter fodinae]|jgi:pantoate--beta-alanine ligase|uniref:Pantothenate synthetase n=1 Tax=Candidatus Auribacter fodinae TaxID=2093366 RepID=A0A3A4R449_9BACT|nr:MAG: pantoate--beta-alanine ligase [Candidatus Auribacter fodinae]